MEPSGEAHRLAAEQPDRYFYANQYDNPANWQAHYQTTGPEIWQQTDGKVTHFVAGLGTSGTITGVTRYLKERSGDIKSIAAFPDASFHGIEGLRHYDTCSTPAIYDPGLSDDNLSITTEDAYQMVRTLALEEGLFVGIFLRRCGSGCHASGGGAREGGSWSRCSRMPDINTSATTYGRANNGIVAHQ